MPLFKAGAWLPFRVRFSNDSLQFVYVCIVLQLPVIAE